MNLQDQDKNRDKEQKIQELEEQLVGATGDSRLEIFYKLAKAYRNVTEKMIEIATEGYTLAKDLKSNKMELHLLTILGEGHAKIGSLSLAFDYFTKAKTIATKTDGRGELSKALNNLGLISIKLKDFDKAEEFLRQAMEKSTLEGDLATMLYIRINLATISSRKGDQKEALQQFKDLLPLAQKDDNKALLASTLNNIGYIFATMNDSKQAIDYILQALAVRKKFLPDGIEGIANVMHSLATAYWKDGQTERAIEILLETVQRVEEHSIVDVQNNCYELLAEIYEETEDFESAFKYQKLLSEIKEKTLREKQKATQWSVEKEQEIEEKYRVEFSEKMKEELQRYQQMATMKTNAYKAQNLQLIDVFEVEFLQAMQDNFAKAVGNIPSAMYGANGEHITQLSNPSKFCNREKENSERIKLCSNLDKELAKRSYRLEKPLIMKGCFYNLVESVIPIIVDDVYLGVWKIGPVSIATMKPEQLKSYASVHDIDRNELSLMAKSFIEMDKAEFEEITAQLSFQGKQLSLLASQIIKQQRSSSELERVVNSIASVVWKFEVTPKGEYINSILSSNIDLMIGVEKGTIGNSVEKYFEYVHHEDIEGVMQVLGEIVANPTHKSIEYRIVKANGEVAWVNTTGSATKLPYGNVELVGTSTDITEKRRRDELIQSQNQQLRMVMSGANIGWWDWDIPSGEEKYNDILPQLLGYEVGEIEPSIEWWNDKIHPDDLSQVEEDLNAHFAGKTEFYRNEHRLITKSGEWQWFVDHGKVVERDSNDRPIRMVGTIRNIHERKLAEQKLRNSEETLRSFINNARGFGVYKTKVKLSLKGEPKMVQEGNQKRQVVFLSPSIENIMGLDDVYDVESWGKAIHPDDSKRIREANRRSVERGEVFDETFRIYHQKREEWRWLRIVSTSNDRAGNIRVFNGIVLDITKQKEAETEKEKAKNLLETVINNNPDWIWAKGKDFRYIFVNDSAARGIGKTSSEVIGKDDIELGYPKEIVFGDPKKGITGFRENDIKTLSGETINSTNTILKTVDGENRVFEGYNIPLKDGYGKIYATLGIARDITQQKKQEMKLKEFGTAVEQSTDGIALVDMEGQIKFVNRAWADMHGYTIKECKSRYLSMFHTKEQLEQDVIPFNKKLIENGHSNTGEVGHLHKNGKEFPTWMTTTIVKDEKGASTGMLGIARDITKQKEAEVKKEQEKNLVDALLNTNPDWIYAKDKNFRYIFVNEGFATALKRKPEDFIGKNDLEMGFPEWLVFGDPLQGVVGFRNDDIRALRGEHVHNPDTTRVLDNSSNKLFFDVHKVPLRDGDGNIYATLGIAHDITKQKKAEAELRELNQSLEARVKKEVAKNTATTRESLERIKTVLDFLPVVVYIADMESYELLFLNKLGIDTWGSCVGKKCWKVFQNGLDGPCSFCTNHKLLDSDGNPTPPVEWEFRNTANNADYLCFDKAIPWVDGRIVRMEMAMDITKQKETAKELRKKEEMLVQQARLAAMGEMIGNIAHQWRQPLTALSLNTQVVGMQYAKGLLNKEKMDEFTKESTFLIEQMSNTIDDFRNFFKSSNKTEPFFIADAINDAMRIVDSSFSNRGILLEKNLETKLKSIGFRNEFAQVILNLIGNSRDAVFDNKIEGGWVKIVLTREEDRAVIMVEDNGGGIDDAIIHKIFDPYFSTKDDDKGTGVGLYMSKMIVNNMSGEISAKNSKNGAVFTIIIPLC